jgi:outer membrane protein
MQRSKLAAAALAAILTIGLMVRQAHASGSTVELETGAESESKGSVVSLGLGAASVPDYEGSEDYRPVPLILAKFVDPSGWYVELLGNTLRANLVPSPVWRLGPVIRYRAERSDVDNRRVDRMEDVDAAIELGGFAGFEIYNFSFKVEAAKDVADGHDGLLVGVTGGYTWLMAPWRVTLSGFTTYADDNYMSTYFGVTSRDSARSGIRTFNADAGFKDTGGTLVGMYRFTEHWGVTLAARYARLIGDAANSPLVDGKGNENQFLVGALGSYSF